LRDILTVLAAVLIVVLAAALVAPPFIDWGAHRVAIDAALGRAAGTELRTEGAIAVRLLPSPRVRFERLQLGEDRGDGPSLSARAVEADIALTSLLRGEVRFTRTRIERAELRLPMTREGGWALPLDAAALRREWAFEDAAIARLLVTTVRPATGRTDQFLAEAMQIGADRLTGPWRIEGAAGGVPFRVVTGELTAEQTLQIKATGGGDAVPRFEIDARASLATGPSAGPGLQGTARILSGPPAQLASAGFPIPLVIQTSFKSQDGRIDLDPLSIEAGEGGASVRLTGTGAIRIDDPRLSLKLEGRRLDLDAFALAPSGQHAIEHVAGGKLSFPAPVDLELTLNSVALAQDELVNVALRASLARGRAEIERLEAVAPGQTRIAVAGDAALDLQGGASGRVTVASAASDRFLRYLSRFGLSVWPAALDGQALEASADVSLASPVVSFRNLRVRLGDATLTGSARHTAATDQTRGKLEAQLAVTGLDLAQVPQLGSVFEATQALDVSFILDARNVRHGSRGEAGRVSARIISEGSTLVVDSLDIVDLAGANARVSGRIAPDGSGRITGKVTAQRAAPLVDLMGSLWIGAASRLVPPFLRDGELGLDVLAERAGSGAAAPLRITAKGRAAGSSLEADVVTVGGATETLSAQLATETVGRWLGRPDLAVLRRPGTFELRGSRAGSGRFELMLAGDAGGVRVATMRPFTLGADAAVEGGEADLSSEDVSPFLPLLGEGASVAGPVPAQLRVTLGRERDAARVGAKGRLAGGEIEAQLVARSPADISGAVSLDRLSLPWLTSAFGLNAPPDPRATLWPTGRFGQGGGPITGARIGFKARELLFGRGLTGVDAAFDAALTPESLSVRNLRAGLAGGSVTGGFAIGRQGSQASLNGEGAVEGATLRSLAGQTPFEARLTGNLRFGASGESVASLVSNLSGAGDIRLDGLVVPNADPGALERALPRVLADGDPLASRRIEALVGEELARGPLRAGAVAPASMVGGVLRLTPVTANAGAGVWQGTVGFDLKNLTLDARGTLTARSGPKGWSGAPPAIGLAWRGPLATPSREIDVGPLTSGLAAIVLQRELEKIEAFETEANERLRLNNRREMDRQRERDRIAAEEAARRAAEEAARRAAAEESARRASEEAARRAAEEAARQARLREEAERQARIRAQQEAERQARLREQQEFERQTRLRIEAERQARLQQEAERQARLREEQESERRSLREQVERALGQSPQEGGVLPLPPPVDIRPAPQIGRPDLGRPGG
jgi:uncharacterized protein involved in outer membrane biogenesis